MGDICLPPQGGSKGAREAFSHWQVGIFGTRPSMGCSSRICKLACLPCADRCGLANPATCGRPYPLRLAVRAISPRLQKSSTGDGTHRRTIPHEPVPAAPPPSSHVGRDTAPAEATRAIARVMGGSKKNPPTPLPLGFSPVPPVISFLPNPRKRLIPVGHSPVPTCAVIAWPVVLPVLGDVSAIEARYGMIFSWIAFGNG